LAIWVIFSKNSFLQVTAPALATPPSPPLVWLPSGKISPGKEYAALFKVKRIAPSPAVFFFSIL
jgi:hypothetical protein